MSRPTKEQVDAAIDLDSIKYEPLLDAYNVLRAEVRELAAERDILAATCGELALVIARVDALPAKWRASTQQLADVGLVDAQAYAMGAIEIFARELEAALKP